jgi:hypothetical protein
MSLSILHIRALELHTGTRHDSINELMVATGLGWSAKEVRPDVEAKLFLRCADPWNFSISRHSSETSTMRLAHFHLQPLYR